MLDPGAQNKEHARAALIDQLAYLIDEMDALDLIIERVPEVILSGRPLEGEWSIKEIYGLIAAADEHVRLPNLQAVTSGEGEAELETLDEAALVQRETWNDWNIRAILRRVRDARTRLVDFLRALSPEAWTHTGLLGEAREDVYGLAFRITQEDTDYLRVLGLRLHESHLTSRPQNLQK